MQVQEEAVGERPRGRRRNRLLVIVVTVIGVAVIFDRIAPVLAHILAH